MTLHQGWPPGEEHTSISLRSDESLPTLCTPAVAASDPALIALGAAVAASPALCRSDNMRGQSCAARLPHSKATFVCVCVRACVCVCVCARVRVCKAHDRMPEQVRNITPKWVCNITPNWVCN